MIRVYVLCEGLSEEHFIKNLLSPAFSAQGIILIPIVCTTKRNNNGHKYKGGVSKYAKIQGELSTLCKAHPDEYITMMFDYYRLPSDTPGKISMPHTSIFDKVLHLETEICKDIGKRNFIPNITLHEYEGLLFSSPETFSNCGMPSNIIDELHKIRNEHASPEHIDDGDNTAPSKRILALYPSYSKVTDGTIIARNIGLDKITSECHHFDGWIKKIMSLRTE
jgi:hypothetical protein